MTMVTAKARGMVFFWCSPNSIPESPTSRKVAGVRGDTGKPVVIWPKMAALATLTPSTPRPAAVLPKTGRTPK